MYNLSKSTRTRISLLTLFLFAGGIIAYAQVIGPTGIEGFPWVNATNGLFSGDLTSSTLNTTGIHVLGSDLDVNVTINVNFEWAGTAAVLRAGENVEQGDLVYLGFNGNIREVDADSNVSMPCIGIALENINNGNKGLVLLQGWVYNSAWTIEEGDFMYVSTTTGEMTGTAPSGSGDQVQVIGTGISEDLLWFNPDFTVLEIS